MPISSPTISPSSNFLSDGKPWTTSSLTDMQTVAGKGTWSPPPLYPLKDGAPPDSIINFSASVSNSFAVAPTFASFFKISKTAANLLPPSRILPISSLVLMLICLKNNPRYLFEAAQKLPLANPRRLPQSIFLLSYNVRRLAKHFHQTKITYFRCSLRYHHPSSSTANVFLLPRAKPIYTRRQAWGAQETPVPCLQVPPPPSFSGFRR